MALYTRPSSGSITTQYLHLYHLGSIAEVTNASGAVDVSENFDAFGQRRDAADWSGAPAAGVLTMIAGVSQRGYTFHTNLESSSLVHMNGRIADGLTGRFLSADPYVTNPGGTQFFNRYSYVNNNPLSYTDPSGYCAEGITTYICGFIIDSVIGGFLHGLFGGSKNGPPPPPKGCWQNPNACWGKGGSSKLFDVVRDILSMPGARMGSDYGDLVLYYQQPQSELGIDDEELTKCRLAGSCEFQRRGDPDVQGTYGFEVFVKIFSANSGNYGVHKIASAVRSLFGRNVGPAVGDDVAKWTLGRGKSATTWANQMARRGWSERQIGEALGTKGVPSRNAVNPGNAATRHVHPQTGQSVVIDNKTKEIIHIGGRNFDY